MHHCSCNKSIRTSRSCLPEQSISGYVWVQRQYVTVKWAWLALPASLLVLAIVYLCAAYFETRRSGVGPSESSPLALLFHSRLDVDAETFKLLYWNLNTPRAMQCAAADLTVKIPRDMPGTIDICTKVVADKTNLHRRFRKTKVYENA
jgi:hypothetical protein